MVTIFHDDDADLDVIRGRRVAVIGYGNQGRAHALNLRDSSCDVRVGLYSGSKSWSLAQSDGFTVHTTDEAASWADLISILLADQHHKRVFEASIAPNLVSGNLIIVAHGFSIHYGQILPPANVDVAMVAPVSPGSIMRQLFREGIGVPANLAVHHDATGQAEKISLSYAKGLGCTRTGVMKTTFREETETDLFGEQAVLCGGLTALIKAGFDTLVEAGYQPELAYFECVHQVKLIVDLIYQNGLAHMFESISDTAEYGSYVSGPRIIDDHVKASLQNVLKSIQEGEFARRWIAEYEAGMPTIRQERSLNEDAEVEQVGERLRALMRDGHGIED